MQNTRITVKNLKAGQDRSVKTGIHARTTDKGNENRWIYSLLYRNSKNKTVANIQDYALLQPQQRFMDSESAKGGFSSLMFNGVPFIADSHCPASHIFMLNEKYLHLFYHPSENFRFEPFSRPLNQNIKIGEYLPTNEVIH